MTDVHEVPIEEAAARLGLTVDALRLRIRRGKTIKGYKRGGRWYALLPDDAISDAPRRDGDATAHANGHRPDASADATVAVYERLVNQQQAEIGRLVEQLAVKDEQLRQANVIIARLSERPLELPARVASVDTAPPAANCATHAATAAEPSTPAPPRRWWHWPWQRASLT